MDFMNLGLIICICMFCIGLLCAALWMYIDDLEEELELRNEEMNELKEICKCFKESLCQK